MNLKEEIETFCKSERQWRRDRRIEHAVYQASVAKTVHDKDLWNGVRNANGKHPFILPEK